MKFSLPKSVELSSKMGPPLSQREIAGCWVASTRTVLPYNSNCRTRHPPASFFLKKRVLPLASPFSLFPENKKRKTLIVKAIAFTTIYEVNCWLSKRSRFYKYKQKSCQLRQSFVWQGFDGVPAVPRTGQKALDIRTKSIRTRTKSIRHPQTHPLQRLKDKDFRRAFFHFSLAKGEAFFYRKVVYCCRRIGYYLQIVLI
jgi:uncharacterized protein Usg